MQQAEGESHGEKEEAKAADSKSAATDKSKKVVPERVPSVEVSRASTARGSRKSWGSWKAKIKAEDTTGQLIVRGSCVAKVRACAPQFL